MGQKNSPFSPEQLLAILQQFPTSGVYWVGYSGGADSTALLCALQQLKSALAPEIKALHVNHGLHPDADAWQAHCERYCAKLGIELQVRRVRVNRQSGTGLEAEARRMRYGVVEETLRAGELFLTAHHRSDQAETLLLNLVRGSGVDGLAAMPVTRVLGRGLLARPLLEFSMQSLRQYLLDRNLEWLEDPSNLDQSLDRNHMRQHIIPELEERWPGVSERIVRSAGHCRDASSVLAIWADETLAGCLPHERVLDLALLDDASPEDDGAAFRILVRRWLAINQAPPLPTRRLHALSDQLQHASTRSHVCIEWEGWVIHQFKNQLWLQAHKSISICPEVLWDKPGPLDLGPSIGVIEFQSSMDLPPDPIRVSTRSGGGRIHIRSGGYHKNIKDVLREAGVPPWLRPSVPLLYTQKNILAVGDLVISTRLDKWLEKNQSRLAWRPSDPVLQFVHKQCQNQAVDHAESLG